MIQTECHRCMDMASRCECMNEPEQPETFAQALRRGLAILLTVSFGGLLIGLAIVALMQ